jgi:putative cell wall-binding protein
MTITQTTRRLVLVAVVAMLASLLPVGAVFAQDQDGEADLTLDLEGQTNVEYAITWSQLSYPDAALGDDNADNDPQRAFIGRDDLFADNLASGALQDEGPLLYTASDALSEQTVDELNRLGVTDVTILGLENAVSEDVAADLEDAGFTVDRIGGETRIETAVAISQENGGDTAILARGFADDDPTQAFADSLAAGAWAAAEGHDVLLTQTEVLTGNTAAQIAEGGYSEVIIVGGASAISSDVEAEVAALVETVTRVAGETRFETAVEIANARGFEDSSDAEVTLLIDGQGANSWADGFSAANLAGVNNYPIVLANSADDELPQPTADFLVEDGTEFAAHLSEVDCIAGSSVTPEQVQQCADETGTVVEVVPFVRPGDATIDPATVEEGGDVTVTIPTGVNEGDTVDVVGCGYEVDEEGSPDHTVQADDLDEDGVFTLDITVPAPGTEIGEDGTCELTVFVNGTQYGPFTVTVTEPAGNQTATTRPELVRATTVEVVTVAQGTAARPAGTYITYEFDETVASADFNDFYAYSSDNNRYRGDALFGFTSGATSVVVRFDDFNTQTGADALTLATVDDGAVTDFQGQTNPEGDDAIGTTTSSTGGTAGVTDAPDLLTVGNFRASSTTTNTAVDFTFDEAAFVVTAGDVNGFNLVTTGNLELDCVAPANNTDPSGGTIAGGSGTTTITVICENDQAGTGTTTLTAANIARGFVLDNTVSDASTGGNTNPLQAADVSAGGNTTGPDLVSAEFQPDAVANEDRVIFVFDQAVTVPGFDPAAAEAAALLFNVYLSNDEERTAIDVEQVSATRVAVDFANGVLATAVGASVEEGAVTGGQEDEVGVQNDFITGRTSGETTGPQLTAVALTNDTDATGTVIGIRATYTFDEDVDLVTPGFFYLVQADGDRFFATNCTNPASATNEDTDNTVFCTEFSGVAAASEVAELGSAVVGTVDFGAVTEEGGSNVIPALPAQNTQLNPEGAELATGTTGTPQQ